MLLWILLVIIVPIAIFIQWNEDKGQRIVFKLMGSFMAFWMAIFIGTVFYTIIVFSLLFILPTHNVLVTEKIVYENGVKQENVKEYEREFDSVVAQYWFKNKFYQINIPKN